MSVTVLKEKKGKVMRFVTKEGARKICHDTVKNELAAKVLVDKYFLCDDKGIYFETKPQHMWDRLAKANAVAEEKEREVYEREFRRILDDFKFVPGGRILYGLGNDFVNATLKNCYVMAIKEDSIKGIFDTAYKMAETYKSGGGCGIDISPLRPKGSVVKNAARESTGAVSFMDFYSHITGMIGQKARIGALIICLDVSHPDIEDFITIKGDNLDKVRYANISVKITDEFMDAVQKDTNFDLHWGGKVYKTIKAKQLWDKITHYAWKRAEPGILFWDTACGEAPSQHYPGWECIACNPCFSGHTRILTVDGYKTARGLWEQGGHQEFDGKPSLEKYGKLGIIGINGETTATNVYRTSESSDLYRITLDNGMYVDVTENHQMLIGKLDGVFNVTGKIFAKEIKKGMLVPTKHRNNFGGYMRGFATVESMEHIGKDETFCLTEVETNTLVVNGIIIGNCAEIILPDGDSCNLGSMNLSKYVENSFTSRAKFDFDAFKKDIKMAVRFLDNIITLEKSPMEYQQAANDNGRRIGLGVMGLADMLVKMKTKYGSLESYDIVRSIMESLMIASYEASCDLAEEKGSFPIFDYDTHMKSGFIKRLPQPILDRMKKTGLRNISLNALAPTGSLSCVAQCSASIEPIFMNRYIRKTNLGTAKKVEEHEILHPAAEEYLEKYGGSDLPDYFVEAHTVDPKFRVKLQGMTQGMIDQSISQTVAFPQDITRERIAECYFNAWKKGCKGITVYRDGSREGVLVKKSEKGIVAQSAPSRPKELDARVHVIKPNGKEFAVFVGFLGDRIYEVFALDNQCVGVKDGVKGKIIKSETDKGNIYSFENGAMMVNQLNRYEDSDASLITRLLSTALRYGTPLEFAIDQISKSKILVNSFARAIARALSLYIKPEEVVGKFKCPECKSNRIKFEGACLCCVSCGYSRCT